MDRREAPEREAELERARRATIAPTAETELVSEEFLGIEEAARIVRLTSRTVRKLVTRGELPVRKIGNIWRVGNRQLMECLNPNAN